MTTKTIRISLDPGSDAYLPHLQCLLSERHVPHKIYRVEDEEKHEPHTLNVVIKPGAISEETFQKVMCVMETDERILTHFMDKHTHVCYHVYRFTET